MCPRMCPLVVRRPLSRPRSPAQVNPPTPPPPHPPLVYAHACLRPCPCPLGPHTGQGGVFTSSVESAFVARFCESDEPFVAFTDAYFADATLRKPTRDDGAALKQRLDADKLPFTSKTEGFSPAQGATLSEAEKKGRFPKLGFFTKESLKRLKPSPNTEARHKYLDIRTMDAAEELFNDQPWGHLHVLTPARTGSIIKVLWPLPAPSPTPALSQGSRRRHPPSPSPALSLSPSPTLLPPSSPPPPHPHPPPPPHPHPPTHPFLTLSRSATCPARRVVLEMASPQPARNSVTTCCASRPGARAFGASTVTVTTRRKVSGTRRSATRRKVSGSGTRRKVGGRCLRTKCGSTTIMTRCLRPGTFTRL